LVLSANGLAGQQLTRSDRSSDKQWSKKWPKNQSKTWYSCSTREIGRHSTCGLFTQQHHSWHCWKTSELYTL